MEQSPSAAVLKRFRARSRRRVRVITDERLRIVAATTRRRNPLPHPGMTPKDADKTAEILQGGPTTSGSRVHRWRDRRLAPISETDATRYKSDLDIATRHPLSGEVFPNPMNDGQLHNMT